MKIRVPVVYKGFLLKQVEEDSQLTQVHVENGKQALDWCYSWIQGCQLDFGDDFEPYLRIFSHRPVTYMCHGVLLVPPFAFNEV